MKNKLRIQIYKPHFRVRMEEEDESYTFITPEIKNLVNILRDGNHEVEIVSESDDDYKLESPPTHKILINGKLYLKEGEDPTRVNREKAEITRLFDGSVPQYYFQTDKKIVERCRDFTDTLDLIDVTQSSTEGIDGELEKIFLYQQEFLHNTKRTPKIVYIGNGRKGARNSRVKNLLINSGVDFNLFGTFDLPQCKGSIKFKDSRAKISEYAFGLLLTEDLYKNANWKTPRIFENILANTVFFMEEDYPTDFEFNEFRKVHSGADLKLKMFILQNNPDLYKFLLEEQRASVTPELLDGSYMLSKLEEVLNGS